MALELGITAIGEHDIGKRKFMRQEPSDAVDVMSGIKNVIDPNEIMNLEKRCLTDVFSSLI